LIAAPFFRAVMQFLPTALTGDARSDSNTKVFEPPRSAAQKNHFK